jgi:hypothetical protein
MHRPRIVLVSFALASFVGFPGEGAFGQSFIRGDADGNGVVQLTDAVIVFASLFLGDPPPPCLDSADANDDGRVDISDGVFDLGFLFLGGDAPPAPFPDCGVDPTDDDVPCGSFPLCEASEEPITVFGRVLFDTGEPVEGATITVSAVEEESIARVAAVLVANEDGKTLRKKKHERLGDGGRAAGRVALGIIDSVQTTTDAAGLYQADIGPSSLPARILVEVLVALDGFPVVESAKWEVAIESPRDMGTIVIPNPAIAEVVIEGGAGVTDDGSVSVENLPDNVDRFFACAYDPDEQIEVFPGEFAEMGSIPLNSSVFVWLEALDADGNPVDDLGQAATIRSRIPRAQWIDLEDIRNGTDRIEIPIYTYNEDTDMWEQHIPDGWLEDGAGTVLPEDAESVIVDGTFEGEVYATFMTDHFSWMNVDYAFIGPWTLSRMDRNHRNVDCFYQAIQLAKTIIRSRQGIDAFKKYCKPGDREDADLIAVFADAQGPELKTADLGGCYGEFKGNEQGDRDDQLYMGDFIWDGCDAGATADEKKNTILIMAVTMLHETAHWKWDVKHEDGRWRNREPGGEAGNELEKDLFGGIITNSGGIKRNGRAVSDAQRDMWLDATNWPAPRSAEAGDGGAGDDGAGGGEDPSPLQITISFPKQNFDLGEDLLVSVVYENVSDAPIDVLQFVALEGYPLSFEIIAEGAEERMRFGGSRIKRNIDLENSSTTLGLGETLEQTVNLVRDSESGAPHYSLVQSGLLQVTAFYSPHFDLPETASNTETITLNPGGSVSGIVTNAADGSPLNGATVRAIQNGNELASATTAADGTYTFPELPGGTYNFEARAPGFLRTTQAGATVVAGQNTVVNFSLSSLLIAGQIRIVLSWGEAPTDLDSHFWLPPERAYHIAYFRRGFDADCPFASLDVDDTSSFGPETITVEQLFPGPSLYAVHNFSGAPGFDVSEAMVQVFDSTGLLATYEPPNGGVAGGGGGNVWWTVFSVDGETGGITEINTLGADPSPYGDTDLGCKGPIEPIEEGDTCADAIDVDLGTVNGTTSGALSDGSASCAVSAASPDIWYVFAATTAGLLTAETCGSAYDTALSIHSGCPGTEANQMACNDDACGLQSRVEVAVEPDTSYWIRVSGFSGSSGNFVLDLSLGEPPAPVEPLDGADTCAEATPVVEGSFSSTTAELTSDGAESCANSTDSPDAWYAFTPDDACSVSVTLCGSDYDTALSIHSDCPGSVENQIACNDDSCGVQSAVVFDAIAGTTYLIRVSGFGGSSGAFQLNIDCVEAPAE